MILSLDGMVETMLEIAASFCRLVWLYRVPIVVALPLAVGVCSAAAAPMTRLERQRLVAHLEMTESWLVDEVSGLSPAQLHFRRAPDAWNILEVIEHLNVAEPIYWEDLQKALKTPAGTPTASPNDAAILWYGIDRTHRERAVPAEEPKGQPRDLQAGLEAFRRMHAQFLQYVRTTSDDLRSHMVQRQGCDAYQWLLLISAHEQRHILQIRETKADPHFPKS
jgi:hypothetical protein